MVSWTVIGLVTILLLVNLSNKFKASVTLDGTKRDVLFEKGETVQKLRFRIMRTFSDKDLDKTPAVCLKVQEHDKTSGKDLELPTLMELHRNVILIVTRPRTVEEKERCRNIVLSDSTPTGGPIAFHPINNNVPYRFWSPVFGGSHFVRRGPNNIVDCKGNFTDPNTILTSVSTRESFVFMLEDKPSAKRYALTATSARTVVATEIKTRGDINNTMRFIPYYYWSFTLLKNMNYSTLYLACFANGEAKMVPMNNFRYPDTRALFIFNRFEPPGS